MTLPALSPHQQIKPHRFELRMSSMFAALFVPVAVHLAYLPLWLQHTGFTPEQIGIILSAPMFIRLLTTSSIASFADRASDRAHVLSAVIAATMLISAGYFLPPSYWGILGVSLALSIAWSPQIPLIDSIALSGVRRFQSSYAGMRIWGSIGFLASTLAGGAVLRQFGPDSIPVMITAGLAVGTIMSFRVPRLGRPRLASPLSNEDINLRGSRRVGRRFVLLLVATGIVQSTHGYLYTFASIYWRSIGIDEAVIGTLWAAGVAAEITMFLFFNRAFSRVPNWIILLFAGVGATLRWSLFPLVWTSGMGIVGFFATQALHSVTTSLILLGIQKVIAESVSEDRIGSAQGIWFFVNGLAFGIVTLASGPLYDRLGVQGFYVMAATALAGSILIVAAGLTPKRRGRR